MTNRFLAMLLVMAMAMLGVCLLASAADLVSPKLSPRAFGPRKLMKVAQGVFSIACLGFRK